MTDDNTEPQDQPEDGTFTEDDNGDVWYEPPEATRRDVVKWLGGIATSVTIVVFAVAGIDSIGESGLATDTSKSIYSKGTHLVNKKGDRLNVNSLDKGSAPEKHIIALPEVNGKPLKEKKATTLLLRYKENDFKKPTHIAGTAKGYVAYSMVCTHAGCLVQGHLNGYLHCPCHGSEYDGTAGAKVVAGPAPRPIPQLPIAISKKGNLLITTGPFEGQSDHNT